MTWERLALLILLVATVSLLSAGLGARIPWSADPTRRAARQQAMMRQLLERGARIAVLEASLRASEVEREKLLGLVEHSQDFLGLADLQGRLTYLNPGGRRMIGFSLEGDPALLHFTDYVPAAWRESFQAEVLQRVHQEGQWAGAMELRHLRTGESVPVLRSTFVIRDRLSGAPLCYAAVSRDRSEPLEAERRRMLQDSVGRALAFATSLKVAHRQVLEEVGRSEGWELGAVWEIDEVGEALRCSELWHPLRDSVEELETLTREIQFASGEDLVGEVWKSAEPSWAADLKSLPLSPRHALALRAGLRRAVAFPLLRGGVVAGVIEFLASEMREPDERTREMFAAIGRQVGLFLQRWHAEEQVRELNASLEERVRERTAELEAANRELEAFSYSVSHDLRAPLRAVDGFSQLLLEDFGDQLPIEGIGYLRTVRSESQRMGRLIDDLLALSRLGRLPLVRQPIDVEGLVRSVLLDFLVEVEGRVVELRLTELAPCHGDPILLRQVWINLLANAFKYTRHRSGTVVEVGSRKESGAMTYWVRDNGAGFDMRYVHKLFGVFERLHAARDYEGTGVGLAIVKRIVERHGGEVWAEGEVGRGACFSFSLREGSTD